MLTKELIKPTWRQGRVYPRFLKASDAAATTLATDLISLAAAALGQSQGDIDDMIAQLPTDRFRTRSAFWKILADAAGWEENDPEAAAGRRWQVLEKATELRQSLSFVDLAAYRDHVGEAFGVAADALADGLFSDLAENRVMTAVPALDAATLIERYNLHQVQGLLIRAQGLALILASPGKEQLRGFLRRLKFSQLVWDFSRFEGEGRIEISGPLSIFDQQQTYGIKLAQLLPAILAMGNFRLEANVNFGGKTGQLILDQTLPIKADPGGSWVSYIPVETKEGLEKLQALPDGSTINLECLPVTLGRDLSMIPDFLIMPADGSERIAVELFHRWHEGQLTRRLAALDSAGLMAGSGQTPAFLIGVSSELARRKEVKAAIENSSTFARHGFTYAHFPTAAQLSKAIRALKAPTGRMEAETTGKVETAFMAGQSVEAALTGKSPGSRQSNSPRQRKETGGKKTGSREKGAVRSKERQTAPTADS